MRWESYPSVNLPAGGFIAVGYSGQAGYYTANINKLKGAQPALAAVFQEVANSPEPLILWIAFWILLALYLKHEKDKIRFPMQRLKNAKKSANPEELMRIAQFDESPDVRKAAVMRIADENFLKDIAVRDASSQVRSAAIDNIHSEKILQWIYKNM